MRRPLPIYALGQGRVLELLARYLIGSVVGILYLYSTVFRRSLSRVGRPSPGFFVLDRIGAPVLVFGSLLLFVVANMTKQPLTAIVREAAPFIFTAIVLLAFITVVPESILWLPRLMGYKG